MSEPKFIITNTSNYKLHILEMFLLAPNYTADIFKQSLPLQFNELTSKIVEDLKYNGQLSKDIANGRIAVVEVSQEFFSSLGMSTPVDAADITPEVIGAERTGVAASLLATHLSNPHAHPQYVGETFVLISAADAVATHASAINAHPQYSVEAAAIVAAAITTHTNAADPHVQYTSPIEVDAIVEDAIIEHSVLDNPHPQYLSSGTAAIQISDAISAHTAETNPHFQYATTAELVNTFADHSSDANPHPQYETSAEVYEKITEHTSALNPHSQYATNTVVADSIDTALTNHVNLSNPHSQYATISYSNAQMSGHLSALDPHSQYITSSAVDTKITAHVSLSNPHSQYALAASIDGYVSSSVASQIASHVADPDAHPQYASDADITSAISDHVILSDPHNQYQQKTEKNAALGYAGLDSSSKLNISQIPTGTTSVTVALGDAPSNAVSTHAAINTAHGISSYGSTLVGAANSAAALVTLGIPSSVTTLSGTNTGDQTITLTGDITGSGTSSFAATISANSVTNAKLANISTATFKGRATAGTGVVEDLTVAQATSLLNTFTSTLKGLVPASGGGTTTFLRADGTFSSPVITLADGDYGDISISGSGTSISLDANVVSNAKIRQSAALSVLGRSANTIGNISDISASANSGLVLREDGTGAIGFGTITSSALATNTVSFDRIQTITTDKLLGRDTAGTGNLEEISLNATLEFTGAGTIQRAALTGDITATAGSNSTTLANNVVSNAKLRASNALSVIGRSVNTSGNVADISAVASSGSVLREDGAGNISFGTISSVALSDGTVSFAKIQNITTDKILGRDTTGTGVTEEIGLNSTLEFTGAGAIQRAALTGDITASAGSNATSIAAGVVTNTKLANMVTSSFKGRVTTGTGVPEDLTSTQATSLLNTFTSALKGLVPASGGGTTTFLRADGSFATPTFSLSDGDYGDISVSGAGTILSVDNNSITDAKLRQSSALSIVGRSANTTGNVSDISAIANSGSVLRENGSGVIGFGTIGTSGITDAAISFAKIQNITTDRLLGRDTALSGAVEEISLNSTLEFSGTGSIQRAALTGDVVASAGSNSTTISSNVVSNAKLSTVASGIFKARATAGTGNIEDITSTQATALLDVFNSTTKGLVPISGGGTTNFLRADGAFAAPSFSIANGDYGDITVSAAGATWTIDPQAVTDSKFRNSAALSLIGRSANTSGSVADISAVANSGSVLRENGSGVIGFGTIGSAGIADNAVIFAKIQTISTDSLLGRDSTGTGVVESITLNSTLEFSGSGTIQRAALTGDITASAGSNATTIANNIVSNSKLSTVSSGIFKARATAGTGNVEDLTGTQATALLDVFNSTTKGLVPLSGGGTTTFLRADGTFAAPAGAALSDGDYGDVTVSSGGTAITIDAQAVTDTKLRNSAALSILGRSANTSGSVADISVSANSGLVLRESGSGTLGFGTISTAGIADSAVTLSKIQTIATDTLLGRDSATTGVVESIGLNATLEFTGSGSIQRAALTGDVTASAGSNATTIANSVVSTAKMGIDVTAAGKAILTAADATAQRTALGTISSADSRLTDARAPTSHATTHRHGGSDEIAVATAAANAIPKADGTGKLDIGWMPTPNNTLTSTSTAESLSAAQGKALQDTKQKLISSGTAAPSGGSDGDIYIQYS